MSATAVFRAVALAASALALGTGCQEARPSALTPGAAKKHIVRGQTTQAEVIEIFGTPNVITTRDRGEMWVYDKVSSETASAVFGIGGLGGGFGQTGAGGGALGLGLASARRSETTVMLIIYFDENDVVRDYRITQTKF